MPVWDEDKKISPMKYKNNKYTGTTSAIYLQFFINI